MKEEEEEEEDEAAGEAEEEEEGYLKVRSSWQGTGGFVVRG